VPAWNRKKFPGHLARSLVYLVAIVIVAAAAVSVSVIVIVIVFVVIIVIIISITIIIIVTLSRTWPRGLFLWQYPEVSVMGVLGFLFALVGTARQPGKPGTGSVTWWLT
jgi:hypothetical protein